MYRSKVIFLDKNDNKSICDNEGNIILHKCHNFLCSDIMNIILMKNLTDNPKIMYISEYNGTQEEKFQNISELIEKFKDDNIIICTVAYVSTIEFPEEKYYYDNPEEGKEPLPIDEVLEREALMLEKLGFLCVNEYTGYEFRTAYIYPNEMGQKIIDIMLNKENK